MSRIERSWIACALGVALASAPVGAQQTRSSRGSSPASLGIHGFSVVLVIGNMQGTSAGSSDMVPESARKALADMKDFLPYKRYQLLDAAWMLCCASAKGAVSGRVRGPNERDYTYFVDPMTVSDSKLTVRFSMRQVRESVETGGKPAVLSDQARLEHSRQLYEAIRERDEAEVLARSTKQKFDVGLISTPDMEAAALRQRRAAQRVEELQRLTGNAVEETTSSGRNIIDSTFSIALGETVVIGTSRLNGDQALIAILTAAAKPGAAR